MSVDVPAAPAGPIGWQVRFKPRADLYAKANEAALLLRELGRLGETSVELDTSGLPALTDLDPEAAYLAWTVTVTGDTDETSIREVFEFVDGDCELEVEPARRRPGFRRRPATSPRPLLKSPARPSTSAPSWRVCKLWRTPRRHRRSPRPRRPRLLWRPLQIRHPPRRPGVSPRKPEAEASPSASIWNASTGSSIWSASW